MGNTSSTYTLSLLKIRVCDHGIFVYADETATRRENPHCEIEHIPESSQLLAPIDPEGGVVALAVWPGAIDLVSRLFVSHMHFSNKEILELGCGIGLPGIALSKFMNPQKVVLTDRESARVAVEGSIAANQQQDRCVFESFDWGSCDDLEKFSTRKFDFVIGSEIVYAEEQAPLINALLAVTNASSTTRLILSYRNRSEEDENYFNSEILKNFKIEEKISDNIFIFYRIKH